MQYTKKHKVLNRKKQRTNPHMVIAYNKQSGYKRHLETMAGLSFPPKKATLKIKAKCTGLLFKGKTTGKRKTFSLSCHHPAYTTGLSSTDMQNTEMYSQK